MGIKGIIIAVAIATVVAGVSAFALHYNQLVKDNATMAGSIGKLEITLGESQEDLVSSFKRIDEFAEALEEQAQTMHEIQVVQEGANEIIQELENVFDNHDLEKLLKANPNLIITHINRGTANRLRMLECSATGNCADDNRDEGADDPAVTGSGELQAEKSDMAQ